MHAGTRQVYERTSRSVRCLATVATLQDTGGPTNDPIEIDAQ